MKIIMLAMTGFAAAFSLFGVLLHCLFYFRNRKYIRELLPFLDSESVYLIRELKVMKDHNRSNITLYTIGMFVSVVAMLLILKVG